MKKITVLIQTLFIGLVFISCNSEKSDTKAVDISWDINESDSLSYLDNIHLCTELNPETQSLEDESKIDTVYFGDSKGKIDSLIQYIGAFQEKAEAVGVSGVLKWENYRTLKVKFLDGEEAIINRVINSAKQWENYCGVRFLFGNDPNPDITISFLQNGSWSYIGSYCKKMIPSMNLGWLSTSTPEEEVNRVVLHEFGHAIGLVHEHLSPNVAIQWDKERVYQYYELPPNRWNRTKVDINIFSKYSSTQVNATAFDSLSIMLYAIPKELTLNGFSTRSNTNLSAKDIEFIKTFYPQ